MKKRILPLLLVAVLALSIGYAAVTAATLEIDGRAEVTASDADYRVYFEEIVSQVNAEGAIKSDLNATMFATDTLNAVGDQASMTYKVTNDSASLFDAKMIELIVNEDQVADGDYKYFKVEAAFDKDGEIILAPGESVNVTVTVTLLRTVLDSKSASIDVSFKAEPVEKVLQQ